MLHDKSSAGKIYSEISITSKYVKYVQVVKYMIIPDDVNVLQFIPRV